MDLNDVYSIFKNKIKDFSNIEHIRKTSDDAISDLYGNYDFVYIDGLHTYEQVKKDIENYLPLIKKEGFIGGHDYHNAFIGVIRAIDEKFVIDKTFIDSSWIKRI